MIRITDDGTSYNFKDFNGNMFTTVDRKIYLRLQMIPLHPLGSLKSDSQSPIKNFIEAMESYYAEPNTNTPIIDNVDDFYGSLGVSLRYPIPSDSMYDGEING